MGERATAASRGTSPAARRRRSSSPSGARTASCTTARDRTGWWNLYRGDDEPVTALEAEIGGPLWFLGRVLVRVPGRRADRVHRLQRRARPARRGRGRRAALRARSTSPASSTSRPTARARCSWAPPPRARRACWPPTSTPASWSGSARTSKSRSTRPTCPYRGRSSTRRAAAGPRTRSSIPRTTRTTPGRPDERPPLLVRVHGGPTAHVTGHDLARDPALHQPRLRRRRRQLRRQHRLRARVPRAAEGPLGRRRHRGRGQRRPLPRAQRARSTARGWRSPAAARAAGPCSARSSSTPTSSPPAPTTSASRTSRCSPSDTHKFESRYVDWLVGPETRAPIDHVDALRAPVIVLQGLEDRGRPAVAVRGRGRRRSRARASSTRT